MEIPKEAQPYLQKIQLQTQQLQSLMTQKQSVNLQLTEIDKALEELGKVKKEEVFKAVGPILIKSEKKSLTKELKERKETLELQSKKLGKHEKKTRSELQDTQKKVSQLVQNPAADNP